LKVKAELALTVDRQWKTLWTARMENPLDDVETLRLNPDGTLKELGKKPQTEADVEAQYMGLIKIPAQKTQEILKSYLALDTTQLYDGQTFENLYMTSFIQHLINSGNQFHPVIVNGGWLEVDSHKDLMNYERMEANGELGKLIDLSIVGG
jgi:choline kinase